MTTHYLDGLVLTIPDEFENNTISFRWAELRPSLVRELSEIIFDIDPRDPRLIELNTLYNLMTGNNTPKEKLP